MGGFVDIAKRHTVSAVQFIFVAIKLIAVVVLDDGYFKAYIAFNVNHNRFRKWMELKMIYYLYLSLQMERNKTISAHFFRSIFNLAW